MGRGPIFRFYAPFRVGEAWARRSTKRRLIGLLEPAGCGAWASSSRISTRIWGGAGLLRFFIDRDGGVTLDDCQRVSEQTRRVARCRGSAAGQLRARGVVAGVRLAGCARLKRTSSRFAGERTRVELKDARDGRRSLTGLLKGAEGGDVLLEVDRETWRLPLSNIAVARLAS